MIALRTVFERVGLPEDWDSISDEPPSYRLQWHGVDITIARMMSLQMTEIWNLSGMSRTSHTLGMIDFAMPLEVESHEQGVAWIAENLLRNRHLPGAPQWLQEGLEWRHELPWVKKQMAYAARECCTVERDWFRLPAKSMRGWSEACAPVDTVEFAFDGEVLRISAMGQVLAVPAQGAAWQRPVTILATGLRLLPARLMRPSIEVSLWDGHLIIDRLRLPLVQPVGSVDAA